MELFRQCVIFCFSLYYTKQFMKSVNCSKPGYTVSCSKIENMLYNLIFTTKFNDSSILITIISWDYLNLSLANEYVGEVTITWVIKYNQFCSRRITQSNCSIQIKLNYDVMITKTLILLNFIIYNLACTTKHVSF